MPLWLIPLMTILVAKGVGVTEWMSRMTGKGLDFAWKYIHCHWHWHVGSRHMWLPWTEKVLESHHRWVWSHTITCW